MSRTVTGLPFGSAGIPPISIAFTETDGMALHIVMARRFRTTDSCAAALADGSATGDMS